MDAWEQRYNAWLEAREFSVDHNGDRVYNIDCMGIGAREVAQMAFEAGFSDGLNFGIAKGK